MKISFMSVPKDDMKFAIVEKSGVRPPVSAMKIIFPSQAPAIFIDEIIPLE